MAKNKGKKKSDSEEEIDYSKDPNLAFLSVGSRSPFESKEKRYRRNLLIQFVVIVLLLALNITAFAMYYSADKKYEDDCRALYNASLERVVNVIQISVNDEFNYDMNYREIIGEISNMRSLITLIDDNDLHQKSLTELYYSSVKLPDQFKKFTPEILEGLKLLQNGKDTEGFTNIMRIIDEMDTLDY